MGKGFAQAGSYGGDHASEVARIELKCGVGGKVVGGFLIGACPAGGAAHESGDSGGVGVFESEEIIKRATSVVGLGMVMIVAMQLDFSEEGVDAAGAVVVAGFKGQGRFIVGQQGAVVVEAGNDFKTVGVEGVA